MSLSEAKSLGAVGSILVLLTAVPSVGWILGIIGFVMTLVAIKQISEAVNDRKIYGNMITSVILAIGAIAVGTAAVIGTVLRVMGMGSFVGPDFIPGPNIGVGDWIGLGVAIFAGLVVVWGLLIASAVFLRRSYNAIAARLNVKMFETAALLYLIGAVTAIIGVGFLLLFVADILLAVAFLSIQEPKAPETSPAQAVPVPK